VELWPAIDLRGGKCVRLLQGDYDRETVFGDDPVAMVRRFVDQGAKRLHIVDLDGAKAGQPVQADLIARMVAAAGVPCQLGGGIRSLETARAYAAAGVARLVVGSVAIEQPALLEELATALPGRIVLGLDARDGRVAVRGWLETSPLTAVAVAQRHEGLPLAGIVYTDIANGTLSIGSGAPDWAPSSTGCSDELEDFGDAIEHLRGHRVAFHMEPFETPACRMAFILDPDGNALCIHQHKPGHG
jgi:phosphoribosylformimino-5-aminoimidazole carboxamide ribotide isomerase